MRYLTKEWYRCMQNGGLDAGIRASKKAASFDESYFRSLYARLEREWVERERDIASVTFDEIYPENYDPTEFADVDDTEGFCPMTEAEYAEMREMARAAFDADRTVFDEAGSKAVFASVYRENLAMLRRDLPQSICDIVADMRVLALGVASSEAKSAIAKYARECRRMAERTLAEYDRAAKRISDVGEIGERFSFHDARVISCRQHGKNLVISIDPSQSLTDVTRIVFSCVRVIEKPSRLAGAVWLYEELYRSERGFEVHALLERAGEPFYLTLECEAIALS